MTTTETKRFTCDLPQFGAGNWPSVIRHMNANPEAYEVRIKTLAKYGDYPGPCQLVNTTSNGDEADRMPRTYFGQGEKKVRASYRVLAYMAVFGRVTLLTHTPKCGNTRCINPHHQIEQRDFDRGPRLRKEMSAVAIAREDGHIRLKEATKIEFFDLVDKDAIRPATEEDVRELEGATLYRHPRTGDYYVEVSPSETEETE